MRPTSCNTVKIPTPRMSLQHRKSLLRQRTFVGRGAVRFHVLPCPHSWNHRGDSRIRETESQRHFRQRAILGTQIFLQGLHSFYYLLLSIAAKVIVAEIVPLELGVLCDLSSEAPFVKWNPGDHADVLLLGQRKKVLFRGRIKDVVDHLYRVDQAGLHKLEGRVRLMIVD